MSIQYRLILNTLFISLLLVSSATFASNKPSIWYQHTDIQMPKVTTVGSLENGLRYVILPTTRSSNELSLRVRIDAGVAQENGINPTARIAALNAVYGSDWNVATDYQQIVFSIDFESASVDDIELALKALYTGLQPSAELRESDDLLEFAKLSLVDIDVLLTERHLDNLMINNHFIYLDQSSLDATSLASVQAFEQNYFTPNNTSIVVVGGIESKAVVNAIKRQFELWSVQESGKTKRSFNHLELAGNQALVDSYTIRTVSNLSDDIDSKLQRKELLMATLANEMLEHRIKAALKAHNLLVQVDVDNQVLYDHRILSQVRVLDFNDEDKRKVFDVIKAETQNALSSGFTQAEYEIVVNLERKRLEGKTRRNNPDLYTRDQADRLVSAINSGSVYTDPSYDLDLLNFHVAHLNEGDISKELEYLWSKSITDIM